MRPAPTRGAAVVAGLVLAFAGIGRTTGAGWVVVLLCGLGGLLLVAAVAPLTVLRAAVTVRLPRDATAGSALLAVVSVRGGGALVLRLLDPPSAATAVDGQAEGPIEGELVAVPQRRGVVREAVIELASAWPLGLVRWRRVVRVPLAVPLEVGPRPAEVTAADLASTGAHAEDGALRGRRGATVVRGVRDYVEGDAIRLVHWPATARWGALMVRELEDPDRPGLAVIVDLRGAPDAVEDAASRAAGIAGAAVRDGLPVTLLTVEPTGPVVALVTSPVDVGRRLARAVPGVPPIGPVPAGAAVLRVSARP